MTMWQCCSWSSQRNERLCLQPLFWRLLIGCINTFFYKYIMLNRVDVYNDSKVLLASWSKDTGIPKSMLFWRRSWTVRERLILPFKWITGHGGKTQPTTPRAYFPTSIARYQSHPRFWSSDCTALTPLTSLLWIVIAVKTPKGLSCRTSLHGQPLIPLVSMCLRSPFHPRATFMFSRHLSW